MPTSDESPVTTALGRAIRERRVESGLTQEALAEAAGVSARYVSDLERGRRNPGGKTRAAVTVREISRGEKVDDLVHEVAKMTYTSDGLEHAIVSTKTGQRLIVRGGPGGIKFGQDVRRVILHTHPLPSGPSMVDLDMLTALGQTKSWIYELYGGGLSVFRRK